MEPTVTAPVTESAAPETIEPKGEVSESSSEKVLSGADDPNESFSDFMKRQEREAAAKNKAPKKEEKKVTSIFDKDPVVAKEEPEQEAAEEVEKAVEQALKVGDKEYKASDIEKLTKDYEASTAAVREHEIKLSELTKGVQSFIERLKTDPTIFQSLEIPTPSFQLI